MIFSIGLYRGGGRVRWAVLHSQTGAWYFPTRYGKRAAEQLCARLNREARDAPS